MARRRNPSFATEPGIPLLRCMAQTFGKQLLPDLASSFVSMHRTTMPETTSSEIWRKRKTNSFFVMVPSCPVPAKQYVVHWQLSATQLVWMNGCTDVDIILHLLAHSKGLVWPLKQTSRGRFSRQVRALHFGVSGPFHHIGALAHRGLPPPVQGFCAGSATGFPRTAPL